MFLSGVVSLKSCFSVTFSFRFQHEMHGAENAELKLSIARILNDIGELPLDPDIKDCERICKS